MCTLLPCCKSRKKAPRLVNADGQETAKSIDNPHGEEEPEEDALGLGDAFADVANLELDDIYAFIDGESSGSDIESDEPPTLFERQRANAVCVEVYGAWNQRRSFNPPKFDHSDADKAALKAALSASVLFEDLVTDELAMAAIVDGMSVNEFAPGEKIVSQGDPGDAVYVVLRGAVECYRATEGMSEPPPELPDSEKGLKGTLVRTLEAGSLFGELAILWNVPRSLSVYGKADEGCVLGRLDRQTHQNLVVEKEINQREVRRRILKSNPLLEMLTPEQIAKLVDALKLRCFNKGDNLITQNETGREFFILLEGEAVATVATFFLGIEVDVQEHRKYNAGDLFGERALLRGDPRAASITATVDGVKAVTLSRGKFERLLGPMDQLQEGQYLADPRKLIADFYAPGNRTGPKGSIELKDANALEQAIPPEESTSWFAVYRPTSRDAIAKMLSGHAVGKGLNVKGKSAKKGVLSGFVPFLQISDNDHKDDIEEAPADSRIKLYFRSRPGRDDAMAKLYAVMFESNVTVESKTITPVEEYAPDVYGLDLPEPVLIQAYIKNPNIVPRVGWETGRASEPAFMDLNMHAVRGDSEPEVVLMQFDEEDPMNPRGLLIAYAEKYVKPVVSDFDTFTVGSQQMKYELLPVDQAELALWALKHTRNVLAEPGEKSWTGRWLEILKEEGEKGFHPEIPKYGFGDPTSYSLIGDVVTATISHGAVRHGAECFNYYFPQELDDEYLVVWEGFPDKPWDYKNENGLREFLESRVDDNYTFPMNPVWPVRDKGWYNLLEKKLAVEVVKTTMSAWDPTTTVIKTIEEIHAEFPDGFKILSSDEPEEKNRGTVPDMFGHDLMGPEKTDLAFGLLTNHMKLKKAVNKLKTMKSFEKSKLAGGDTITAEESAPPPETTAPTPAPVAAPAAAPQPVPAPAPTPDGDTVVETSAAPPETTVPPPAPAQAPEPAPKELAAPAPAPPPANLADAF